MELNDREKELLEKLRAASKKDNTFTLVLKINDIVLEERAFSADKYSVETLSETRTHFMMNDLVRIILKNFAEHEEQHQDQLKKEQMDKMWEELEKEKNKLK